MIGARIFRVLRTKWGCKPRYSHCVLGIPVMAGSWQFGMDQFDFQPRLMQKFVQLAGTVMCGTMRCVGNHLPHLLNHEEQMEQLLDGFMTFYLARMHGSPPITEWRDALAL